MAAKPYTDPTTGEWVGEYETSQPDGTVSRRTEWFATEQEAREFARTGARCEEPRTCRKCGSVIAFIGGAWVVQDRETTADGLSYCPPNPDADRVGSHQPAAKKG